MSDHTSKYRRTDRFGQEQEKIVVWLPVELKDQVRRVAGARQESMNDTITEAVTLLIARVEQAEQAVAKARADRARLVAQVTESTTDASAQPAVEGADR